jgi:indolepyruvate ferredoxin oxidoreductase beta subunit
MREDKNVHLLIVGVGGQGVVTLSDLVARVVVESGLDVKQSEVHGMAQRGGSVSSHVRIGRKIHSPIIDPGSADVLLALERLEALRFLHYLSGDGLLIVNDRAIPPVMCNTGAMEYPADVLERCRANVARIEVYCGADLAQAVGSPLLLNTCFAGVLSRHLPIEAPVWQKAITDRLDDRQPEANLKAFQIGREAEPSLPREESTRRAATPPARPEKC